MWNGNDAKRQVREQLAKRLITCAIALQGDHTADLSTSYPPASTPGQFPHGRTWNLRSAVDYEPKSVAEVAAKLEVRVGYQARAAYILALIRMKRLSLRDTLKRIRPRLNRLLGIETK